MSAFEDFIQVELPRRPWVAADPAQETVAVRRGAGPRQLTFVSMADGQVLGKVGGVVQGITIPGLGTGSTIPKNYIHTQASAAVTWTVVHNLDSVDGISLVFNSTGQQLIPDEYNIIDADTVEFKFQTAQAGKAIILFAS